MITPQPRAVSLHPAHLICHCQVAAVPRLTLCGLDVDHLPRPGVIPCVVCWDLGRSVIVARRCERCAS